MYYINNIKALVTKKKTKRQTTINKIKTKSFKSIQIYRTNLKLLQVNVQKYSKDLNRNSRLP